MDDSIIGLLFVLLPAILGLVGKKLEKAGKDGKKTPSVPEVFPAVKPDAVEDEGQRSVVKKTKPKPAPVPVPQTAPVRPVQKKSKAPYDVQEDKPRNREKIDPKKLVIYSELMKPKF